MLIGRQILLGITGGIAAYKTAELVRLLVKAEAQVRVVMTRNACQFITPLTLQTLSGHKVYTDTFEAGVNYQIEHISLTDASDLTVVAPATANIIGKFANGIADDLLSTLLLAAKPPILLAPAMNTRMWENPAVQQNIEKLKTQGVLLIEPGEGELACKTVGKGRMAEPEEIFDRIKELLAPSGEFSGTTFIITAGPTREALDPVRFISNRSSGRMGYALAKAAQQRGARVILVSGPTQLPPPEGIQFIPVESARQMHQAVMEHLPAAMVVIKAAAVADYRPVEQALQKIKKGGETDGGLNLRLTRNPDILAEIGQNKGARILVGFAAETIDLIKNAREKLQRKNLDLIVANDVTKEGAGFVASTNIVKILDAQGNIEELPLMSKEAVAQRVLDRVAGLLKK